MKVLYSLINGAALGGAGGALLVHEPIAGVCLIIAGCTINLRAFICEMNGGVA